MLSFSCHNYSRSRLQNCIFFIPQTLHLKALFLQKMNWDTPGLISVWMYIILKEFSEVQLPRSVNEGTQLLLSRLKLKELLCKESQLCYKFVQSGSLSGRIGCLNAAVLASWCMQLQGEIFLKNPIVQRNYQPDAQYSITIQAQCYLC